jgi:hypothetical protein
MKPSMSDLGLDKSELLKTSVCLPELGAYKRAIKIPIKLLM